MVQLPPPIIRVSPAELRARFNRRDFSEGLRNGTVVAVPLYRGLADPSMGQPPGTLSLLLSYRDAKTQQELARVHQYQQPGGRIGASGRPDPKRLLDDGAIYVVAGA